MAYGLAFKANMMIYEARTLSSNSCVLMLDLYGIFFYILGFFKGTPICLEKTHQII